VLGGFHGVDVRYYELVFNKFRGDARMKKVLYGTTALLAVGLLSTQVSAGAVDGGSKLDVTLGGYGTFKIEYKSRESTKDDTVSYRNHNADFDSELSFKGTTTLDNGTSVGIEIQLETSATSVGADIIDENFIWVDGTLGKVYLGGRDAEELEVGSPGVYSGVGLLAGDKNSNEVGALGTTADIAGENNKVSYRAPKIGGLDIAVNYTPELVQNTTSNAIDNVAGATDSDLLVGLQWGGTMGGADVKLSLGYGNADAQDTTVDSDIKSNTRQRVGFEVSGFSNLTIGGFWLKRVDNAVTTTPAEDRIDRGFGVKWVSGDWTIGGGIATAKQDEINSTNVLLGSDEATRTDFGIIYALNSDMNLKVGYRQEKHDDDQNLATDEQNSKSFDVKLEWNVGTGLEFDVGFQNFQYTHHDGLSTSAAKSGNAGYVLTKVSF